MLSNAAVRSGNHQYAADKWGVHERTADEYIRAARDPARRLGDRPPYFTAELLSQLKRSKKEARKTGQGHIALGCINSAAKLAQLIQ